MAILTTCLLSFLLYGTSKYFPESLATIQENLKKRKLLTRITALILMILAIWFFSFSFDFVTAIVVFATTFMLVLSSLIISLKLNPQSWIAWLVICLGAIFINFI